MGLPQRPLQVDLDPLDPSILKVGSPLALRYKYVCGSWAEHDVRVMSETHQDLLQPHCCLLDIRLCSIALGEHGFLTT